MDNQQYPHLWKMRGNSDEMPVNQHLF